MRAAVVVVLALAAACTPDIAPGSYLCGPERSCPEDQACDGVTNICVLPSQVQPFACPPPGETTEVEPNDDTVNAQLIANLACVSRTAEIVGCARDLDSEDWFLFDAPQGCTAVAVEARLTFPLAFEVLSLEVRGSTGLTIASGGDCAISDADDGDEQRCLDVPLTSGSRYALRVARSGVGTCGGACAHNKYTLTLQLKTP